MRPRNEEMIYFLMWTAETLLRSNWRNLSHGSFEGWAWRNGLGRRLAELERAKMIERSPEPDLSRIVRLTEDGRRHAWGGRDPAEQWSRAWDGRWRVVMFDLPAHRIDLRKRVWRRLRAEHFGYLQQSVWVTPDPPSEIRASLGDSKVVAESLLVMEGTPAAGESDAEIVVGAWDFSAVNAHYEAYLRMAKTRPPGGTRLVQWARRENALWRAAVAIDPLLPSALLPANYLGQLAWQYRRKTLAQLGARAKGSFVQ